MTAETAVTHRTPGACAVCDRAIRATHTDAADYPPGTIVGIRGFCLSCYKAGPPTDTVDAPYPPIDRIACAGDDVDPEVFFPVGENDPGEDAKAICSNCPVRRECLAYALTHSVEGVWGGKTDNERRALRRQHGIRTVPLPTWRPAL